MELFAESES